MAKLRTTKHQEARQIHRGKAHFNCNSLSAMRSRLVFQTPLPGIAMNRLLCERGILAGGIMINGIQRPVEHGHMKCSIPSRFHFANLWFHHTRRLHLQEIV
jgi:hypothetical protein